MSDTRQADVQPTGLIAATLALHGGDVVFVAADEQRAEAIAEAVAAFAPTANTVLLPSSDALPGDDAPASPANVGRRLAALRALRARGDAPTVLVTTAEATAVRYPPPTAFDAVPPRLAVGDAIDMEAFTVTATEIGYFGDDLIDEPGEIAVRGQVIDIFPADRPTPIRIDVEDGRIMGIRSYDPVTQLTLEAFDMVEIGRAAEPAIGSTGTLLDHFLGAAVALDGDAARRRRAFLKVATDGKRGRRQRDSLLDDAEWRSLLDERTIVVIAEDAAPPPRFVEMRNPNRAFVTFARKTLETRPLLVTGSQRDLRFITARLAKQTGLTPVTVESLAEAATAAAGTLATLVSPVDRGFGLDALVVVAGGDLLGGRARADDLAVQSSNPLIAAADLRSGDVVVHQDFGIGIVAGLEGLPDSDHTGGDAIVLDYAKGGRRLIPATEADRIWRYGADADAVTLDSLDGATWEKRRSDIEAAIAESAKALAALAVERDARTTDAITPEAAVYESFAAGFAFTETPDQLRAINAVRADLASGKPMDRLVVGDVGYGKTEVALRAAAHVALAGRQVAIVAPTTVLVRQHLETFAARFADAGIEVAGLSRLSSAAEKKRVKAGLADGTIRVVVGTGAVAAKDVCYQDLALVVIDEEQRFGAADKAKIAGLGAGHVLTLSATPIPRTLQSALIGLQQVSVIATPPARRQPIRTTVAAFDETDVRAALLRERSRGGQSFVVVPRIDDMEPLGVILARLVPELNVVAAHGKMPAGDIDAAMVGFANGDGDVLLATNIIEAGLDVPRANTMIVHHADRFGLSQLHQLRGRVGRGGRRGQILLLTAAGATIAEPTLKRLRALQAFDRLGAGFAISARDLDMRGAGDLLGDAQAGHMKLIGIDLYQHLMGQALRAARGEDVDDWRPDLRIGLTGRFPEDWVPEIETRLSLYGRLARLVEPASIDQFEEELEDRFGALPDAAQALIRLARVRTLAFAANVARIDAGPAAIALTPRRKTKPPIDGLDSAGERWLRKAAIGDPADRAEAVEALLADLVDA